MGCFQAFIDNYDVYGGLNGIEIKLGVVINYVYIHFDALLYMRIFMLGISSCRLVEQLVKTTLDLLPQALTA